MKGYASQHQSYKLILSWKKKNPSCELSGSCINSDVNASCHLHCDFRGKMEAEFEDDADEANS